MTETFDAVVMTDGSCGSNGDQGAWVAIVVTGIDHRLLHGTEFPSTNNRCELLPIIRAIHTIHDTIVRPLKGFTDDAPYRVLVLTDSEHVQRGYTEHHNMKSNADLWAALRAKPYGVSVTIRHVPRNSTLGNHACDIMAGLLRGYVIDQMQRYTRSSPDYRPTCTHKDIHIVVPAPVLVQARSYINNVENHHAPVTPSGECPSADARIADQDQPPA